MKFLILFFLVIICGCVKTEKINDNIIQVKGYGVDTTFYPVFAIRVGIYEYIIIKDKNNHKNDIIIIK